MILKSKLYGQGIFIRVLCLHACPFHLFSPLPNVYKYVFVVHLSKKIAYYTALHLGCAFVAV